MSEEARTVVLKFGGSSVADADRMREVALIIKGYIARNYKVSTIVSAMGNTTNELLALAGDVTDELSGREIDQLLATGEQQSIALLAMALKRERRRQRHRRQVGAPAPQSYHVAVVRYCLKTCHHGDQPFFQRFGD